VELLSPPDRRAQFTTYPWIVVESFMWRVEREGRSIRIHGTSRGGKIQPPTESQLFRGYELTSPEEYSQTGALPFRS